MNVVCQNPLILLRMFVFDRKEVEYQHCHCIIGSKVCKVVHVLRTLDAIVTRVVNDVDTRP